MNTRTRKCEGWCGVFSKNSDAFRTAMLRVSVVKARSWSGARVSLLKRVFCNWLERELERNYCNCTYYRPPCFKTIVLPPGDQVCSNNISLIQSHLNVSVDKPFFMYGSGNIFEMYDPSLPHKEYTEQFKDTRFQSRWEESSVDSRSPTSPLPPKARDPAYHLMTRLMKPF